MSAESLQDWAGRKHSLQRILSADERLLIQLSQDKKTLEAIYEKQKTQYADKAGSGKKLRGSDPVH